MGVRLIAAALALGLPALSGTAAAHMPLARELALSPDGEGLAVRLPGFGWVVRAGGGEPAYLCDALVGVEPSELELAWTYLADGSLLIGSAHGLRRVGPDGCPEAGYDGGLGGLPVAALATAARSASTPEHVYLVSGETPPVLYRSIDQAQSFTAQGPLPGVAPATGMVVAPDDAARLYVSQASSLDTTVLAWTTDGGVSFDSHEHSGALVPLHAMPAGAGLLAREGEAGRRGTRIVRAARPDDPLEPVLELNFYGGFAASHDGELWVGDEGGGLYLSLDGGEGFAAVQPRAAVACLSYARGALWACTPGLPAQPAVARIGGPGGEIEAVLALAEVERLVQCAPQLSVEQVCAPAFREWQLDVLGAAPPLSLPDTDVAAPADERRAMSESCAAAGRLAQGGHGAGAVMGSWAGIVFVLRRKRRSFALHCVRCQLPRGVLTTTRRLAQPRRRATLS